MARSSTHHGQRHAGPYRQLESIEQAPPSRVGEQRQSNGCRGKYDAHQSRIEDDNTDIAWPACATGQLLLTARSKDLPGRHGREDPGENDKPDERLISK
jgi:hypothetical protein